MIPDYERLMLPLLEVVADGQTWTLRECRDALASRFDLTDAEALEMIPSGLTPLFNSRVHWAKTYLGKAGLVDSPARGTVRITDRGLSVLAEDLTALSTALLTERFEEMRAWRASSRRSAAAPAQESDAPLSGLTPDELIQESYARIRAAIQSDLLDRVHSMPPERFEKLVLDLLLGLGYGGPAGTAEHLGRSGDGGLDGVIRQDKLGLERVYVQAKRWQASVGSSAVREFAGSLAANRADKGVIITTSSFTADAVSDAEKFAGRIVLVDGAQLVQLMYEVGIGVSVEVSYIVKRLDSDYFETDV
jgi:restriction system protein